MLSLALAALIFTGPTDTPVSVTTDTGTLHGSLMRPQGDVRATAVIIPGSGPTDRDGNNPLGVRNASLKQLAEGLAEQGIATVRIDKRGIAQSRAAGPDEASLSFTNMAEDARNWAKLAIEQTGARCAWLIGHSEGALVAQSAASQADTPVCGLLLLSGSGRPAGVVLREQLAPQLPPALMAEADAALTELEAGRTLDNPPPALAALFRPSVQPYMISWLALDPAALASNYDGPIFIGQGTTDIQTSVTDARALSEAQPRSTLKLWDGINHVLTEAPEDRAANIATYGNPEAKIAPQVVEDVSAFIKANTP
ncbi:MULTISPECIES: alpha/beta hydrolase [unclassified Brevundimonas]|uniref:alpha/beta hydrolase n=1 Tax=unclassified Brevundimonas TaxID=2622653 RepID=UPI0025BAEF9C|nr:MULTISPECIES: alpha/beta fold hydrolase [unclassified Brevundimonas]